MQEEPKRQYSLVPRELTANAGSLAGPEWFVGVRGRRSWPQRWSATGVFEGWGADLAPDASEVVASRACRI